MPVRGQVYFVKFVLRQNSNTAKITIAAFCPDISRFISACWPADLHFLAAVERTQPSVARAKALWFCNN
jgi:hypothetical protein